MCWSKSLIDIPRSNNCFSASRFPLDTELRREDHISFFGVAFCFSPVAVEVIVLILGLQGTTSSQNITLKMDIRVLVSNAVVAISL
jgi:hypothetical protein